MEKIPLTPRGFASLDAELKRLKSVDRPAVIRAIAEAREHGDLSENAEYHSAREKQSFIEGRIKELESVLSLAEVIDPAKMSGTVKFGATVTCYMNDPQVHRTATATGVTRAKVAVEIAAADMADAFYEIRWQPKSLFSQATDRRAASDWGR